MHLLLIKSWKFWTKSVSSQSNSTSQLVTWFDPNSFKPFTQLAHFASPTINVYIIGESNIQSSYFTDTNNRYSIHLYKTRSVLSVEGSSFCSWASRSVWSCSSCCSTAAGTKCGWLIRIWERNCPIGDSSWSGAIGAVGPVESEVDEALIALLLLLLKDVLLSPTLGYENEENPCWSNQS